MKIGLIYAKGTNNAFGNKNKLPWSRIDEDMHHFAEVTTGQAVLMGRKTYESLPAKYRPLPDRTNIVLTSTNMKSSDGVHCVTSFIQAMAIAKLNRRNELWIIGGSQLLQSLQQHASVALVTEVDTSCIHDVTAPELTQDWKLSSMRRASLDGIGQAQMTYRFLTYIR